MSEKEQLLSDLKLVCSKIGRAKRQVDEAESIMQRLIQKVNK